MIRKIVIWPDPVLSQVCERIEAIDDDVRKLAADMLDTMYQAPGRGLAAPQVGVPRRMFVMDTAWKDGEPDPVVMVNPEIVDKSLTRVTGGEGCLSIPGVTADVERAETVTIRWTTLEGDICEKTLTRFDAICAQHELDHLDGIVTFDRLAPETRADLEKAYAS